MEMCFEFHFHIYVVVGFLIFIFLFDFYVFFLNTTMHFQQSYMKLSQQNLRKERQNLTILNNLNLSLEKKFTLCFTCSFSLVIHFLFFVSNKYLYIDLYTDISINIPPLYSKIKHCYSNIIKGKTVLSFSYMSFTNTELYYPINLN